jgi:hypothetical protein
VEVESVGDLSDRFPLVYEPARNGEAFLIELPEFLSIAAAKFFSARAEFFSDRRRRKFGSCQEGNRQALLRARERWE